MKKTLLSIFIGLIGSLSLSAQCVPDTNIQGVVVPPAGSQINTSTNTVVLPYAFVGQSYSEVIHFKVPADTFFAGLGNIPINHVKLDGILGLPATFTLACTPSNCTFPGGTFGCAQMTGTPTVADSIALKVAIEYNVTISALPTPIKDTLEGYYLVVKGGTIGLSERAASKAPRIFPNPASKKIFLNFDSNSAEAGRLQISSVIGTLVYDRAIQTRSGENQVEINTSKFKPGIYMYSLKADDKTFSGRFTISR